MTYTADGERLIALHLVLPERLHKAWKRTLVDQEETQQQWFRGKVEAEVAAHQTPAKETR